MSQVSQASGALGALFFSPAWVLSTSAVQYRSALHTCSAVQKCCPHLQFRCFRILEGQIQPFVRHLEHAQTCKNICASLGICCPEVCLGTRDKHSIDLNYASSQHAKSPQD